MVAGSPLGRAMPHAYRRSALVGVSFVAALAWASFAAALPFRNGSFEEATLYPPPEGTYRFGSFFFAPSPIVGWDFAGGGDLEYVGADYWQHADGNHSVELNGLSAGMISQRFDTIPGATYHVSFAMSGHPGDDGIGAVGTVGRPFVKHLQVAVDNQSYDFAFDTIGITFEDMGWVQFEFEFVAAGFFGNTSQLTFISFDQVLDQRSSIAACRTDGGCYGSAIDDVRVTLVPEPRASLWGASAVALLLASERRSRGGSARCARARSRVRGSRA